MTYAISKNGIDPTRDSFISTLALAFEERGFTRSLEANGLQFVLNPTTCEHPMPYRRRSNSVFVISIVHIPDPPDNLRAFCYTTLIRSLSNLLICIVGRRNSADPSGSEVYFTTPEAGFYHLPYVPEAVFQRVFPIATAHYATHNDLVSDLPHRLWICCFR